jgi:hypothetical protein
VAEHLSRPASDEDGFHRPDTDDPWWTETAWFSWTVPDRGALGYFYPVFRPNLGVRSGGILVFDGIDVLASEAPIFEYDWHEPIPEGLDLRDAEIGNGLYLRCLVGGHAYEFGCTAPGAEVELHYEAIGEPLRSFATPPFNAGHLDQLGRIRGRMVLRGEAVDVDCIGVRDRSWGTRKERRQHQVGYAYGGADDDHGFLLVSVERAGRNEVSTGFLLLDGRWSRLVSGERAVHRDPVGRPEELHLAAVDEEGRELRAVGTAVSRNVFSPYASSISISSLVRWEMGGRSFWGEDQDVWSRSAWARLARTDLRTPTSGAEPA